MGNTVKRVFFRLAIASVFFACSLSAHVPEARQGIEPVPADTAQSGIGAGAVGSGADPADPLAAALGFSLRQAPLILPESVSLPAVASLADSSGQADMAAIIPRLKAIFEQEGVPQQWVWIAEVESGFDPQAESPAGAVGLFQLMPATAKRFGLRLTPLDDRLAPEKSANAAAQYLKYLRQEFGCWPLALAAYNAGEGRLKGIMNEFGVRTFEEVERFLP
ncbi:MAG: lytic transglycosylase domain-containing protein, partial [Lentisphaerae bacterium]|nr:lytic transglycosylase domain-containing protein [Lentisphaerota bacterium]